MRVFKCIGRTRYYRRVLKEYDEASGPTVFYEDNQVYISRVTEKGKKNKDRDIQYHVCCVAFDNGNMDLKYFPSTKMTVGSLTKPLGPQKFKIVKHLITIMVSFNATM